MKPALPLFVLAFALASCGAPTEGSSSSAIEETPSSSSEVESPSSSSPIEEETSSEEPSPEESSSEEVPMKEVEFLPADFPDKENNTYPVGKVVEKDGVALECSYLMKGNQQRLDGVKEDVFQMKKGAGEIVSLEPVRASITITYLNKGEYTGNLVCYVGSSREDLKAIDPVTPSLADEFHYAVSYEIADQYFAFRNDSSYAVYGTSFLMGA